MLGLCPTPPLPSIQAQPAPGEYLFGYGCDGNDNDNNGGVDECGEDRIPPVIKASQGSAGAPPPCPARMSDGVCTMAVVAGRERLCRHARRVVHERAASWRVRISGGTGRGRLRAYHRPGARAPRPVP